MIAQVGVLGSFSVNVTNINRTVDIVIRNTFTPADISNFTQVNDGAKIDFSFIPNQFVQLTARVIDPDNTTVIDTIDIDVVEGRFFFSLPDGYGGEVEARFEFELDLAISRGAITPVRFATLFDIIDIERTLGYADQDVQSRLIISPTMTILLELLSQAQSDVANFYVYFRDAVKAVRFFKNDVLVFRGELNIEQLEQQGELSLKADFDSVSFEKLNRPFKNGDGQLDAFYNTRYAQYEETFGTQKYFKISNLFRAIVEDFGFDGFEIQQLHITNFVIWMGSQLQDVPVASNFDGTHPLYVDKSILFGVDGVLNERYRQDVDSLGDVLKRFALWLDLVVEFDLNNRCIVSSFWSSPEINLIDDDVVRVDGKMHGVKKLDYVVVTGYRDSYNDNEDYFTPNRPKVGAPNLAPPTFYGQGFAPSSWNYYKIKGLFLDLNRNKAIERVPFFVKTVLDVLQPFGIYIPFTVKFPAYIKVNPAYLEFDTHESFSPTEQTFPAVIAVSAWNLYKKNREVIKMTLRGTNWQMSRNYQTSPTSRIGESLKLKPLEFKIRDGVGETEATFLNIA